jgi:hypothetical protein
MMSVDDSMHSSVGDAASAKVAPSNSGCGVLRVASPTGKAWLTDARLVGTIHHFARLGVAFPKPGGPGNGIGHRGLASDRWAPSPLKSVTSLSIPIPALVGRPTSSRGASLGHRDIS